MKNLVLLKAQVRENWDVGDLCLLSVESTVGASCNAKCHSAEGSTGLGRGHCDALKGHRLSHLQCCGHSGPDDSVLWELPCALWDV